MPFHDFGHRDRLLVRAATSPGPGAAAAWHEWFADTDLDDVPYPEGRLLPQVFVNLNGQGLPVDCLPPRVRGKYRWLWASNQLRADAVAPALRALHAAGIKTVLLKGAASLAAERRSWGGREMGDVDVLVPTARAGDAAAVLEDAGWRGVDGVTARYLTDRLVTRRHGWNFTAGPVADIDLHWHVFEGVGGRHADDLLWRASRPVTWAGVDTARLHDTDHLIHTLEHASHGEPSSRLEWVVDVASLLPRVDESRLVRVVGSIGLHDVVAEGLEIAAPVLESPRAEELARRVASGRRRLRARLLASTAGPDASRTAKRSELLRTVLVQSGGTRGLTGAGAALRRRVEPHLLARPLIGTVLALTGRKRRAEVAALRLFGPLTRAADGRPFPTGEWVEVTAPLLDAIGGPGWLWPSPEAAGIWTDGVSSRLAIDLGPVGGRDLVLGFDLGGDAHHSPNPAAELLVNGRALETWRLGPDPEPGPRHVAVPAWLTEWCRPLQVVFRPLGPFDPWARRGARGDQRPFLQLRAMRVDMQ